MSFSQDFARHAVSCQAKAIIAATENMRDFVKEDRFYAPGDFTDLAQNELFVWANELLVSETTECICGVLDV